MNLIALMLVLGAAPPAIEEAPPPRVAPLTTAQAVRAVAPTTADQRCPVRLSAIVTFYEPEHFYLFVQDSTGGIFVQPPAILPGLKAGDQVVIEGVTDRGRFSPCVRANVVHRHGHGDFFGHHPFNLSLEDARWLDAQRVEVWALVREVDTWHTFCRLRIESDHGLADLMVPDVGHLNELRKLVGRPIRTLGVCAARVDGSRAVISPTAVYVQEPRSIVALPGLPPIEGETPWLIDHLTRFTPMPHPGARRVKVAGTVVGVANPTTVFVQDTTGGVCILTESAHGLTVGDLVEAVGAVRFSKARPILSGATVRVLGREPAPEPQRREIADLAAGRHFGTLATMDATVAAVRDDSRLGVVVSLVEGAYRFDALLPAGADPGELRSVARESRVRLTGVIGFHTSVADGGGGFVLLLRTPNDLVVLSPPPPEPWLTPSRVQGVAGLSALAVVLAVVWIGLLRRQVERQTAELRQQHEQERMLNAQYRDLFETAGDAVWVTDPDGRLVALNRAAETLLNVTRDEVLGQPLAAFLEPDDAELTRPSKIARRGDPFEYRLLPKGRPPVVVEVTSRLLPDGGVQTVARNVTERKQLQERVQRVQTLDVVGRLAGGIAHDFNNLLTIINGNAELIQGVAPPGAPARALADEVLAAGQRAANLTRQLLTVSRPRFSDPCDLNLAAAVAGTAKLLDRLLGGQIEIATDFAEDTPWIHGDVGLIEQVVMNLSVNARDAMPSGGTLTVRTHRGPDGKAILTVADTGVGMTPEVQARLYEPFFTTKDVGKGTGLGLATVYAATQALGGHIRCHSKPGRGTTFTVEFAARPANPVPGPVPAVPDPVCTASVLVVEDDDAVRLIARQVLERHGLRVVTAASGEQALQVYRRAAPRPDLVLTDVRMPRMTGLRLAEILRAEFPTAQVVFMSGFAGDDDPELEDSLTAAGALLRKPFTADGLHAFVRAALLAPAFAPPA